MIRLKNLSILALTALLTACGGGGGGTMYQTTFNANVSGLETGESITLVASLYADKTLTQTAVVSQNGMWSTTIKLPEGLMIAFDTKIEVTKQPAGKSCVVTYPNLEVNSLSNTIKCLPISPSGFYTGKLGTTNGRASLLIMNDGSYWMWAGTEDVGTTNYSALIQSDIGKSTATSYTSTSGVNIAKTPFQNNLSLLGTYVSNTSFVGTLTENALAYPLTLTPTSLKTYQFSDSPTLEKITGTYASAVETITISPAGILSGSITNGCQFGGTVTPKTTGENVYAVSLTYGGSPCSTVQQGTTLNGVFVLQTTVSGKQILGAVINNAKTGGSIIITTKK